MDPTATLKVILDAIAEFAVCKEENATDVRDLTIEYLEYLLDWLKNDGFMPSIPDKYRVGRTA